MSDCSSDVRARRRRVEVGKVAVFRAARPVATPGVTPLG